jgi:predicted RecA/RadA family phage recombinase
MWPASSLTGIVHTCAIRRAAHPIEAGIDNGGGQPGDVVAAPACGVSRGDGSVIGNLFGICATDADQTEEVELSLTGVLGQRSDRRGREGLVEHHGCQSEERYGCRALPHGTAVKAAGISDTTVRVRFDGFAVVAAGP